MAGTYTKLLYHFVFSTKQRANLITPELQPRLHEYMGGIVRDMKGTAYRIGGMPDHVHMLVRWRTDETLATLMREVKAGSSGWVHDTFPSMKDFAWQEGYGAFTVSQSQIDVVDAYIRNQVRHHQKLTFQEEFLELLRRHEIDYDERYIWD